jgi:16S rRNA processing protein RimM
MVDRGDRVILGRVSGVFGIKGWVKVWSYTDPAEGILEYPVWQLRLPAGWEPHEVVSGQRHGKGLIVQLAGCVDRDHAQRFVQADIAVPRSSLPKLDDGEFYWHEIEGLRVLARREAAEPVWLGVVDHLLATGANDVLVVRPVEGSVDQRERLIPWVDGKVIVRIDRERGEVLVDWDPDF